MSVTKSVRTLFIKAYRVCISYDFRLIAHMCWNRLRYRNYLDFLKADWPYKFQFLLRHYGHILEKCRQAPITDKPNEGPIWVLWWQGEKHMPDIVRRCYDSLKRNAPHDRPVILLHSENYAEYANIPEYIIEKFKKKIISVTHLSDTIRLSLLAEHGGLWIDSTVFFSGKIPASMFDKTYFSGRTRYYPNSIAQSLYTSYMIGAAAGSPWMVYARDMWFEYWKNSWKLLDYALMSYIWTLALNEIPELKAFVRSCTISTPHINTIQELRNETCDMDLYNEIVSSGPYHKLSYKLDFHEQDENGNLTYYGMLCSSGTPTSCK